MTSRIFRQFIALGDSFTEGMCDDQTPDGRYRGWADRVADSLAVVTPELRYANFAVRGKLLDEVVVEQLQPVLHLVESPTDTLVSFHAGPNDVLRLGADVAAIGRRYARAVQLATTTGATVLLFTVVPRAGGTGRTANHLAAKFETFNDLVRQAAVRFQCLLADQALLVPFDDRRMWHDDRLHLNAEGHRRVAALVGVTLVGDDPTTPAWWNQPLPAAPARTRTQDLSADVRWVREHLLPWVGRRLRKVSSGDGVSAKHPQLAPWPTSSSSLYRPSAAGYPGSLTD